VTTEDLAAPALLGIEAGGTRTVAILAGAHEELLRRIETGPANIRLVSDAQLNGCFREIARRLPKVRLSGLAVGMAGVRTAADLARLRAAAEKTWSKIPMWLGNDLEIALAAARRNRNVEAEVLVLSGTGSCCFGRRLDGGSAKIGGWGHVLGDRGSGFDVSLRALRAAVCEFDYTGRWPRTGARFLRALMLNSPEELINWVQSSSKSEIAALAPEVFAARREGDRVAERAAREAAESISRDALACAAQLAGSRRSVRFILAGGVLRNEQEYARLVGRHLKRARRACSVELLKREGAWGAIQLAAGALTKAGAGLGPPRDVLRQKQGELLPISSRLSPTEQRNARSLRLDKVSHGSAVRLMISEEKRIPAALLREQRSICQAIELVVRALRRSGRLFYVGAGTSGRLGLLDASECPPTFGTPPTLVQGIIAGGAKALWQSVEGAEDDFAAGAEALRFRGLSQRDVVVGIAASGRTPFVWGAFQAARKCRARTVLICFNSYLRFPRTIEPDVVIAPRTGPEILTGSTRLKAGTATKIVLNLITTLSMVGLGKVASNLMVDLHPTNEKLRDRAVRIVQELAGADANAARAALERSRWEVKHALKRLARTARDHPARSRRIRATRRARGA
jgi:N-acetylmuramic acid 6-phosphate etherase